MATIHLSSYFQQRFTPRNPLSDSWLARYESELHDQTPMFVWDMGKRKDAWSRSSMGVSSASIQSETWKNVGSTWAASSTLDHEECWEHASSVLHLRSSVGHELESLHDDSLGPRGRARQQA